MFGYHFRKNINLKLKNSEYDFDSITKLLQAMRYDSLINKKVINILKMDSYPRQIILCNWLEQLRTQNAPPNLLNALSCLFDDKVADQVLSFIKKHT